MAEWSIAAVLKTVVPRGTRGSNPCLSAMLIEYSPVEFILWDFFYDNQSKFLEKVVDQRKNLRDSYITHKF